jgi:hypothetical protein
VFAVDGGAWTTFARGAFDGETTVTLDAVPGDSVAAALPSEAALAAAYAVDWQSKPLHKLATLQIDLARHGPSAAGGRWVVYRWTGASGLARVGGTVDGSGSTIAIPLTEAGTYALTSEVGSPSTSDALTDVAIAPRVLQLGPSGASNGGIAIGFSVQREGRVLVRVYSRSGRLVRELVDQVMMRGSQVVRWDGKDSDDQLVSDNAYIVRIEAPGTSVTRPVAVVR